MWDASRLGDTGPARIYLTVNNFVTNEDDVRTYDMAGVRTPLTIKRGLDDPGALAVDGCGKLYVVNAGNNTITTYDVNGIQTTPTIRTGNSPYAVAIGPNAKIYVLTPDGLTTYNADGNKSAPTITGLSGTSFTVDGSGKIYVTNGASCGDYCGIVTTYTPQGKRTVPTITQGLAFPQGIAVDATGKIYVANYSGVDITTYAANGTPIATFAAPDKPLDLVLDGNRLYYAGGYEDSATFTETLSGVLTKPSIFLGPGVQNEIFGIAVH